MRCTSSITLMDALGAFSVCRMHSTFVVLGFAGDAGGPGCCGAVVGSGCVRLPGVAARSVMWDATAEEAKKGGSAVPPRRRQGPSAGEVTRLEQGLPGLRFESGGRGGMLAAEAPDACPWRESALRAAGNATASVVRALVVRSKDGQPGRPTQTVAGWLARSARVQSSACRNTHCRGFATIGWSRRPCWASLSMREGVPVRRSGWQRCAAAVGRPG